MATTIVSDGIVVAQSTYADELDAVITDAEANAVIATKTAAAKLGDQQARWYLRYGMRRRADIGLGWHVTRETQQAPFEYELDGTDELAQPRYKVVELGPRVNTCEHLAHGISCDEAEAIARYWRAIDLTGKTNNAKQRKLLRNLPYRFRDLLISAARPVA